jgi:Peptidase A4 family
MKKLSRPATVVAAGALVLTGGTMALSGQLASGATGTPGISAPAARCPGGTLLSAVSARRLPAGAVAYRYVLPDGRSFENTAPPPGFNAATASNALLAELHLPPRPVHAAANAAASAAAMENWQAQAAPFSKSRISGSDKFCAVTHPNPEMPAVAPAASTVGRRAAGAAPRAVSVGHTSSSIWAGYELKSGPYHRAVGHFRQPGTNTLARSMSTWIGLNSHSNGRLVQAGAGNGGGPTGGALFWELFCTPNPGDCNSAQVQSQFQAHPGDDVSVNVSYDNSHMSYYQVAINGALDINTHWPMRSDSSTGAVADFITERTGSDALPNTGPIVFSGARTYAAWNSSVSVPFGAQNIFGYEMTNDGAFHTPPCSANPHILMYPSNVTSGGFQNNYCHS